MPTRDPLLKRQKRANGKKGGRKHTVMQDLNTIDAVCMAEMGKNNLYIRSHNIDLSDGQLQYRFTKAKNAAGMKKGDGFRKAWREGRSQYEDVVEAVMPTLRQNYREDILPKVEKPAAEVSPKKEAA